MLIAVFTIQEQLLIGIPLGCFGLYALYMLIRGLKNDIAEIKRLREEYKSIKKK